MYSDKTITALKIINSMQIDYHFSMRKFAFVMWPNSNMHTKNYNIGHGSTTGVGAWLCAGSYIARLSKMGLVLNRINTVGRTVVLTHKGKSALKEAENE